MNLVEVRTQRRVYQAKKVHFSFFACKMYKEHKDEYLLLDIYLSSTHYGSQHPSRVERRAAKEIKHNTFFEALTVQFLAFDVRLFCSSGSCYKKFAEMNSEAVFLGNRMNANSNYCGKQSQKIDYEHSFPDDQATNSLQFKRTAFLCMQSQPRC